MNICKEKYFKLFSSVILVKGSKNSILIDLQRNQILKVSNFFLEVESILSNLSIQKCLEILGCDKEKQLLSLITNLLDLELGHLTISPESFPPIKPVFRTPFLITNMIIDYNDFVLETFNSNEILFEQIVQLNIPHIQIRIYNEYSIDALLQLAKYLKDSRIVSIELYLNYSDNSIPEEFQKLMDTNLSVAQIIVFNSELNKSFKYRSMYVHYLTQCLKLECCGVISYEYFVSTTNFYLQSKNYNSCLYRKISVDVNGNIKNCPSMVNDFGNINDKTHIEVIQNKEFIKIWDLNKDKINICMDCEFRYICTDCRAYLENPNDILSKPLKCGYNPYTGEWNEWFKDENKKNAISEYKMMTLIENIELI
jgi:SPASM domain peptide maturase of grasp-with-spasm system